MAHPILTDIDAFCRTHNMAESTFGRLALGDWRFVKELRGEGRDSPRRLWPETENKVRQFIATYKPDAHQDAAA
jgi:hypothetical protein